MVCERKYSFCELAWRRKRSAGSAWLTSRLVTERTRTILVDQQKHQIVDLLPDREASSLAAWLKNHPEIEIVTRDRGQAYADGIRQGAPQAVQVADRVHLMQNLTDALKRLVIRKSRKLQQALDEPARADQRPEPEVGDQHFQAETGRQS